MLNTVRSSLGQLGGNRRRGSRRNTRDRGGLASQASGFISGFLSGGSGNTRSRGRRRR